MEVGDRGPAQARDRMSVDLELDCNIAAALQRPRREEHEQSNLAGGPSGNTEHLVGRRSEGLDRTIIEHAAVELTLRTAQSEAFPARCLNAVLCDSLGAAAETERRGKGSHRRQ